MYIMLSRAQESAPARWRAANGSGSRRPGPAGRAREVGEVLVPVGHLVGQLVGLVVALIAEVLASIRDGRQVWIGERCPDDSTFAGATGDEGCAHNGSSVLPRPQPGADLGFPVPAVTPECADGGQLAVSRPPGDGLRVDSEHRRDFSWYEQRLGGRWCAHIQLSPRIWVT
jgi:hypothetical protein